MTLNDIFLRLCDVDRKAQALIADSGCSGDVGLGCNVCTDPDDPKERFFRRARITEEQGCPLWVRTRMEHDRKDYFPWLHGSVPLVGLTVRER